MTQYACCLQGIGYLLFLGHITHFKLHIINPGDSRCMVMMDLPLFIVYVYFLIVVW